MIILTVVKLHKLVPVTDNYPTWVRDKGESDGGGVK